MFDPIFTSATVGFASAFAGSALSKAEGPGRALDDMMTLVGFDKLHLVAEKKRLQREQDIIDYKNSIAQDISKIPEENIKEPPLSIVGPALEASKYYIEEETLRKMFSNIISSSMDSRYSGTVHPAFVEIIKQLSPNDALILNHFKDIGARFRYAYPIVRIVEKLGGDSSGYTVINPLVFIYNYDKDYGKNSASVNNLERLGLVETGFDEWFTDENNYSYYKSNPVLANVLETRPNYSLKNGIMRVTKLGQNFITTCVLSK